jgi:hypothetical protein
MGRLLLDKGAVHACPLERQLMSDRGLGGVRRLWAGAPIVEGVILAPEGGRGGHVRVVLGGDRSPVGSGVEGAQQREDLDLHAAE